MKIKKPIPVTIISGALGAGKTTIISKILEDNRDKKFALIENEFGDESIDSDILSENNEDLLIEMSNGCLCCSMKGDMVFALNALIEKTSDFEHLLIESTGLANPASIADAFLGRSPLSKNYQLERTISIVDALHFEQSLIDQEETINQVAFADIIILNKLDLVDEKQAQHIENRIHSINTGVSIIHSSKDNIPSTQDLLATNFFELKYNFENDIQHMTQEHSHHHHHHDEQIQSILVEAEGELHPVKFQSFLNFLFFKDRQKIIRSKGIIFFKGQPKKVYFHGVYDNFEYDLGPEHNETKKEIKIIFIGKNLNADTLTESLKNCIIK